MIHRIKVHNILNGIAFSIIEYMVAAFVVMPFAVYYVVFGRALMAVMSVGIILNCLVVAGIGFQQYRRGEKDVGIRNMFKKEVRERIGHQYPHLGSDTLVLSITVLLPFMTLIWIIGEALLIGSQRGKL